MKKVLGILSLAVASLAAAPVANAAITAYSDLSAWEAAVGGTFQFENFNDEFLNPGLSITGVGVDVAIEGTGPFGGHLVMRDVIDAPERYVTFGFSQPTFAMGAVWNLFGNTVGGPGSSITLNLVGGGTETFVDFYPNTLFNEFRGFVSTTAFTSIMLTEGTGCCVETFEMENMKYVAAAIPEPETYAMLLAGLGLMGFVARRRRRNGAVL